MKYMGLKMLEKSEMLEKFKEDICIGKIAGIKMRTIHNIPIEQYKYNYMYRYPFEITGCIYNRFFFRKLDHNFQDPNHILDDMDERSMYFSAFDYYDGDILAGTDYIPAAANSKDQVQITEYQVLRCY